MNRDLFNNLVKIDDGLSVDDGALVYLENNGYVSKHKLTDKAYKELEPYRVKRAIIMAAGFGSRMVPVTLTTPKPLVRVNGIRFIDTLIKELLRNDIKEIIIVRGYLKDKFDELLADYPFIRFIDNDLYDKENNISSAVKALDYIENTYICESDFLVTGHDVIKKYQYESNYLGTKVLSTDDWCFDVDDNDVISNYRKAGTNCVQAFGISYWNKKDSEILRKSLLEMYSIKENKQKFWEMCIFEDYKERFPVKCRYVNFNSIKEIDSFDELAEIDPSYKRR